jgi:N4-gp56 family major capsid protein
MSDLLGEQAAQTLEELRFNVLKAGTNVFYADGETSRADVNDPIDLSLQRRITRALKRQNARPITNVISSSPAYETRPIEAAYICLVHPDLENDIRNMTDANGNPAFLSTKHYAGTDPMEGEIGAVEDVRYVRSTVFEAWADAGSGTLNGMLSTSGSNVDVYPCIYLARDAFGTVPLRGMNSVNIMVVNPKATETDPLAQRGTAGWKTWHGTVILQDAFMVRAEVGATS